MLTKYMTNKHHISMMLLLFALLLVWSQASFADRWQLRPEIKLEGVYDENIRLTNDPHESVTGVLLKGDLKFSKFTEVSEVSGKLILDLSDYSGNEITTDNNENIYLQFKSNQKTERSKLGVNGRYRLDTTLRNIDSIDDEDDGALPDDDPNNDLVDIEVKRKRLNLSPYWQYELNERSTLGFAYAFDDVSYDDNIVGSGLFDYDLHNVSASFTRKLSERDSFALTLGAGRFESPDNASNVIDTYDVVGSYFRSFSERTSGSIAMGISRAEQKSDVFSSTNDGFVFEVKMKTKTETDLINLSLTHDLQPTGDGSLNETSELKLRASHKFNVRLRGLLTARYRYRKTVGGIEKVSETVQVSPRIKYKLSEWIAIEGGYKYRGTKRSESDPYVDSNAVFLSVSYGRPIEVD